MNWITLCIILACILINGVPGKPVKPVGDNRRRSITSTERRNDNETNAKADIDLCYSLVDNVTDSSSSGFRLTGQTTALFKIADYEEASWEVSMIIELKERMTSRGFTNVNLVIIIPMPQQLSEDEYAEFNYTLPSEKGVSVVYETEDLEHLAADSVTVLDSCGLVVYSIFQPWSSMQYPYVKAAILSAMFDQPCGACEKAPLDRSFRHPLFDQPIQKDVFLDLDPTEKESRQVDLESPNGTQNISSSTVGPEEDASYLVPLRIIIPAEHVHKDTENTFGRFQKFNYYVLKTDDNSYHGHLDSDPAEVVGVWRDLDAGLIPAEEEVEAATVTETTTETTTTNGVSEETFFGIPGSSKITFTASNDLLSSTTPYSTTNRGGVTEESPLDRLKDSLVYVSENRDKYRVRKKYRFGDAKSYNSRNFDEVELLREEVKTFIQSVDEDNENKNVPRHVDDHYGNIIPWLDFVI